MAFAAFILLNALLLTRPEEVITGMQGLRTYLVVIVACLVLASDALRLQLRPQALRTQPITVCVLGLFGAVALSHLAAPDLSRAVGTTIDFLKVVLYYLLFVSVVDTPARLRALLGWLAVFTVILTVLGLLQFHEVIDVEALRPAEQAEYDPDTGTVIRYPRLCSSGMYNDPNDLSLILVLGITISLFQLTSPSSGILRFAWVAPPLLFIYALSLTRSRGGLLALLAGVLMLAYARLGWRKAILLAVLVVPTLLFLFSGRQTEFNLGGNDTAQERLQMWAEGLALLTRSPILGIGVDRYPDEVSGGLVAHNSFVHAFVEMGLIGGTLFAGVWWLALWGPTRLRQSANQIADPEHRRLRPYVVAMAAAYAAGMLSLSRTYIVPTYLVLGIVTAYMRLATPAELQPWFRCDGVMVKRLALVGFLSLAGLKLFTQTFVRYGP